MSVAIERIVILPAIEGIRDQAAVSVMSLDTVRNTVTGVDLSSNDPIATEAIAAYQLQASAQVQKLTTDLAAKTSKYDAEVAKVTALTTEKATLTTEKATLTTEKATLTSDLATANATIGQLQARITELEQAVIDLTPPPAPLSITRYQCDEWLTSANLLQPDQEVEDLIIAIVADPEERRKALKRWKLGIAILRNDPMIETLGQLLGLSTEQLDAAFLVASQIQ